MIRPLLFSVFPLKWWHRNIWMPLSHCIMGNNVELLKSLQAVVYLSLGNVRQKDADSNIVNSLLSNKSSNVCTDLLSFFLSSLVSWLNTIIQLFSSMLSFHHMSLCSKMVTLAPEPHMCKGISPHSAYSREPAELTGCYPRHTEGKAVKQRGWKKGWKDMKISSEH